MIAQQNVCPNADGGSHVYAGERTRRQCLLCGGIAGRSIIPVCDCGGPRSEADPYGHHPDCALVQSGMTHAYREE